jgi:hypothetical protein
VIYTGQTHGDVDIDFQLDYREIIQILAQSPNENVSGVVDRFDIDLSYTQYHQAQIQNYSPGYPVILHPVIRDSGPAGYMWITVVYQEAGTAHHHYPRTLLLSK